MFADTLLLWSADHQRDLPWRGEKDPYKVWVSEIILQQTRVQQGWNYYQRFIEIFPDVRSLAVADEQEVLRLWQGLGYYSRARHLHQAAQQIMATHKGRFPSRYEDIRALKGVGDYTAAAIASFAFGEQRPAVDGNMMRVVSRYFGVVENISSPATKRTITSIAEKEIQQVDPASFNQAMMDFGSLQCTPANPACQNCPLQQGCYACQHDMATTLPIKNQQIRKRQRYFILTMFVDGVQTILEQRTGKDIWHNMYQFPLQEVKEPQPHGAHYATTIREVLTHQVISADIYVQPCRPLPKLQAHQQVVAIEELSRFPMPKIMTSFLQNHLDIITT